MFAEYSETALSYEMNIKTTIKSKRSMDALFGFRRRSARGEAVHGPLFVSVGSPQSTGQGGEQGSCTVEKAGRHCLSQAVTVESQVILTVWTHDMM